MFLRKIALTMLVISISSCSSIKNNWFVSDTKASLSLNKTEKPLLKSSGSFTIVRQVPLEEKRNISARKQVLALSNNQKTIVIDRITGTILLSKNDKILKKIENVKGLGSLDSGKFKIASKSESPLWYASDNYYLNRNIEIPLENPESRYLRGALGEYALYLNDNTIFHNSPLWTEEIGGVKLKEKDLKLLFSEIEVGANVLVL